MPKPTNVNLITCKYVYKMKYKLDESIHDKTCCKGFSKKYEEYFEKTFNPMTKVTSAMMVIILVVNLKWKF